MSHSSDILRTPRKGARLGDRVILAGEPVMVVKSGKVMDFITLKELAEEMYGKPIDHIVFKDEPSPPKAAAEPDWTEDDPAGR